MNGKNIYITDGTSEGFYTALFDAYKDGEAYLTAGGRIQLSFGQTQIFVTGDGEKAARVVRKIKSLDAKALFDTETVIRNREEDGVQTAFLYLRELVKSGRCIRGKLTLPCVRRMMELRGQVLNEVHRLKGFLRFAETEDGVLYAACSPDHDDVDLLAGHFIARLQQPFAIHDVWREKAVMYDGRECVLAKVSGAEIAESDRQRAFASLWKKYYKTVSIPERKNPRAQKNFMPVRYWEFLTEEPR